MFRCCESVFVFEVWEGEGEGGEAWRLRVDDASHSEIYYQVEEGGLLRLFDFFSISEYAAYIFDIFHFSIRCVCIV